MNNNNVQTIFGDEAGFTGENVIDDNQPFFCYATVAISENEAGTIIKNLRKKYNFQNKEELKGKKIFKRKDIISIVTDLLESINDRFLLTIDDKKFSVCCRLFEYIYEPVLRANNSIFYHHFFHLTIANILYFYYKMKDEASIKLFDDIYNYLRWGNVDDLKILFKSDLIEETQFPIKYFLRFAFLKRDDILNEFNSTEFRNKIITPDWLLDLSISKVNLMLAHWGKKYEKLDVILDESKPLFSQYAKICFNAMIDRKGHPVYLEFGCKKKIISYNLIKKPELKSSKLSYGIQIADLLASIFNKTIMELQKHNDTAIKLNKIFLKYIKNDGFIIPNTKFVQFEKYPLIFINSLILHQLDEWVVKGIHPLLHITDFYNELIHVVLNNPPNDITMSFNNYNSYDDILQDFQNY